MSKSKYKNRKGQNNSKTKNTRFTPVIIVLAGIVLVVVALYAVRKAGQSNGGQVPIQVNGSPSLKVDQDKIDLGDVPLGKMVSVSFQLTNVGDTPLQFSKTPYVEVVEGC